ncbi:MAG: hypothetical protein GW762_01270 [Candidatus Pacebacteria bacterium]|nr:hypothetical protein [Candidatus Paceibacterota bacterium]PIR63153.1 MAG: hypothetical protein COU64_06070 [Candidatus Pacebacteria bacterium CG10_big_fil_rev_8_21_14_0_10_40_26]PIZ79051.1 MAG: hypothetical protein COY01_01330 [Candidatus Pacebacteria bacterium CG_4_10_14_0_2_um_filter_40_20]PJA69260.1 MAG: hypothetical protein CO156_01505 [Candidatus Pacebacteria bacterium CG_4_9_14_3_um_filter_40_12]PJC42017.1 MAG: hypothetical protein CO041_00040 [Candidatus Pacebacteria bacterium CG_4_9_
MKQLKTLFSRLNILIAAGVTATLIITSFFGTYFLGDTVTYMQFGSLGGPLTTFIQHDALWPPLFALIFNVVHRIPLNQYLLSSLWVIGVLALYIHSVTFFLGKFVLSKWRAFPLAVLTIVGPVTLLMQSQISEPLMLLLWIASIFATLQFWKTSEEKWLMAWLAITALLPMSRWLGVVVAAWLCGVVLLKLVLDFMSHKKLSYSPWLVLISLGTVWIPTAAYLFKSKVMIGAIFPPRDPQVTEGIVQLLSHYGTTLFLGASASMLAAFLLGLTLKLKKGSSDLAPIALFVTLGSALSYLAGLLYSELSYAVVPHVPFRFVGLSFPFLILSAVFFGILLTPKLAKQFGTTIVTWLSIAGVTLSIALMLKSGIEVVTRLSAEQENYTSTMSYLGWTSDVKQFCDYTKHTYVIFHQHTRNWGTRSYAYLCDGVTAITESTQLAVEKNATIISAYAIENGSLQSVTTFELNDFTTRIYTATESATVDVEKLFALRGVYE